MYEVERPLRYYSWFAGANFTTYEIYIAIHMVVRPAMLFYTPEAIVTEIFLTFKFGKWEILRTEKFFDQLYSLNE